MNKLLCLLGMTLVTSTALIGAEPERVFRAGAAASNITPPLGETIVGSWSPVPATHVHDELHARCLVLDDGESKVAMVLCDNVGIPVEVFDVAKQQINETTGLPATHVLLASTHTHSATTARGPTKTVREEDLTDYQKHLANRISDGVRRAINQLEPARIGWGAVDEPTEVFNRRWFVKDMALLANPFGEVDRVRMNPPRGKDVLDRPAGPVDPEISFISVQSTDGRPIALLANYSLHYVGGVRKGDISADYFGYFAKYITQKLGATNQYPPFIGILSNGTSGDVNNINFPQDPKDAKKYALYEKMQNVAEKVAARVYEAHQGITFHDWVPLSATSSKLSLRARKPTPEMLEHFANPPETDDKRMRDRTKTYGERIARLEDAPDEVQVPLQVIGIGDLGIAAIPFETFTEIGLELKDRSPFADTFTIELANGSFGYLPTPEQHRLGGYETWLGTSFVEFKASRKIVDSVLEMFTELHEAKE